MEAVVCSELLLKVQYRRHRPSSHIITNTNQLFPRQPLNLYALHSPPSPSPLPRPHSPPQSPSRRFGSDLQAFLTVSVGGKGKDSAVVEKTSNPTFNLQVGLMFGDVW